MSKDYLNRKDRNLLDLLINYNLNSYDLPIIEYIFQKIPPLREKWVSLLSRYSRNNEYEGSKVMDQDWDFLIVLDACRFDDFKQLNFIEGKLEKKISMGSNTREWVEKNFSDGYHNDTITVSANSWLSKPMLKKMIGFVPFYHVEKVWDYGWNKFYGTVLPSTINNVGLKLKEKYPDKRLLLFYLQPHHPFIGKENYFFKNNRLTHSVKKHNWEYNEWDLLKKGYLGIKKARKYYRYNLMHVLVSVSNLVKKLKGKIVITSDHGNAFGELFIFSHPTVCYSPLREVPWLTIEK